jgi:hypothetical protein
MRSLLGLIALMATTDSAMAQAQDLATADQIIAAVAGNTVMGSMAATGAYTEFYTIDGTIRAADYAGTWAVSGDKMCFSYGDDPATCWAVAVQGDRVTWVIDGTAEGTGTILQGNPNGW